MAGRSIYDGFEEPQPEWSAYRELSYGYTQFEVTKSGTLHYEFVRNSDGIVSDEFWIVQSLDYKPSGTIDYPETETNQTNETEDEDIFDKVKELDYANAPISILIVTVVAIFKSRLRKV